MTLRLKTPLGEADARKLRAGDSVLLTGVIYTARDAASLRAGGGRQAASL